MLYWTPGRPMIALVSLYLVTPKAGLLAVVHCNQEKREALAR